MRRIAVAGVLGTNLFVLVATSSSDPPPPPDTGEACAEHVVAELPISFVHIRAATVRVRVDPPTDDAWDARTTFFVGNPNEEDCVVAAYLSRELPDLALAPVRVAGGDPPEVVEGFGVLVDHATPGGAGPGAPGREQTLRVDLFDRTGPESFYVALAGCEGLEILSEVRIEPRSCEAGFADGVEIGDVY